MSSLNILEINIPPRVMKIKTKMNKWDVIKFKSFCKAEEAINKKTTQEGGKIFANKGKLDLTLSFLTYKVCKFKKQKSLLYEL